MIAVVCPALTILNAIPKTNRASLTMAKISAKRSLALVDQGALALVKVKAGSHAVAVFANFSSVPSSAIADPPKSVQEMVAASPVNAPQISAKIYTNAKMLVVSKPTRESPAEQAHPFHPMIVDRT